ncbi:MAG: Flp family type IVb pilin [Dehalococcoidia bacterium]
MKNLMLQASAWAQTRRQPREEGQTVIEYALVVAGVSIVLIALLLTFGNSVVSTAQDRVDNLTWPSLP